MFRPAFFFLVGTVVACGIAPFAASAEKLPSTIGGCVRSSVAQLGHRLEGEPHSGSLVAFANGLHQVSYDELPVMAYVRIGDPVLICLVGLPKNCPPGDQRGKVYTTTDLRIPDSWSLPDSEHDCGGA